MSRLFLTCRKLFTVYIYIRTIDNDQYIEYAKIGRTLMNQSLLVVERQSENFAKSAPTVSE